MSVKRTRRLSACLLAVPMLGAGAGVGMAQSSEDAYTFDRAHKGDITQNGGARRLDGDITESFRAQIKAGPAKNVILLIGDGIGDSEITVARNVALGAGEAFKGLGALPVTGQYTHYSVDKDGKPSYVTDSAASGSA